MKTYLINVDDDGNAELYCTHPSLPLLADKHDLIVTHNEVPLHEALNMIDQDTQSDRATDHNWQ